MKVYISIRGLSEIILLLFSIAFLWLTIWSYLQIDPKDLAVVMAKPVQNSLTKALGTAFLVSYTLFSILFFEGMYENRKRDRQKQEGVKP